MKNSVKHLIILLLLLVFASCQKKSETTHEEASADEWPEMDSFHMLMAEAFHPYKDSSNLEPARKLAAELALEADNWQAATLPVKMNTDDVITLLEGLKTDSHDLADKIKAGATDQEIGATLTALHDRFHKITEAWHEGGEKQEH